MREPFNKIALVCFIFFFQNLKLLAQQRVYFNALTERVYDTAQAYYYEITEIDANSKDRKTVIAYYMDGSKKAEMNFLRNKFDGRIRTYFPNGIIETEMLFKNNKLDGAYLKNYPNGKARRVEDYKKGKMRSGKCFDSLGRAIAYFPSKREAKLAKPYKNMADYFRMKLNIPKDVMKEGESCRIDITFTITKEGKIDDVATIVGFSSSANQEIMDVIYKMPIERPAMEEDEYVDDYVVFPFVFTFNR